MNEVRRSVKSQQGTSLIEVMIAMVVLTVGVLGSMALPLVAISGNSRNRSDSTGTTLAGMVVDEVSSMPVGGPVSSVTVTDCAGNTHTINGTGTSSGAGANLSGNAIDFTQSSSSITPGYSMLYTACGNSTSTQTIYDVRWNVETIRANSTNSLTVSARIASWNGRPQLFAIPVSLRTVVGNAGF